MPTKVTLLDVSSKINLKDFDSIRVVIIICKFPKLCSQNFSIQKTYYKITLRTLE